MTFTDCVIECCRTPELVIQFDRLNDSHLSDYLIDRRPPIVRMIDEATGHEEYRAQQFHEAMQQFISFVFEFVWIPTINKLNQEANPCLKNQCSKA